eukprot:TRINITY_DN3723_c0_g1_i1.p1 TRINITY_DN3723_c0_g1~~TRINITY_DN3723_c0_g1_i1.p1  ORF type:complete len:382 (+),score=63.25 TRINITY_DN3723_c0_g1_i1:40-1185(+)
MAVEEVATKEVEETRPQTADAAKPRKPKAGHSLLGLSLGRPDKSSPLSTIVIAGGTAAESDQPLALTDGSATTGGDDQLALTSGSAEGTLAIRSPAINSDTTKRIARRYKAEVLEVEKQRKHTFVPIDQRSMVRPDERDMARVIKGDLDTVRQKHGIEMIGWDKHLSQDTMQKRMQFLHTHANTGSGVEEYGDDGKYTGEFLYGLRHGQGTHEFKKEVYEGEWKWDRRHGRGTLTQADGTKISGVWKAGKPDGFVSITDSHGTVIYEGEYKEGKRHGLGRQIFANGDSYDGGWKSGLLHDRGIYYFANGDKHIGIWQEGRYDGPAMLYLSDGSVSRRMYKDGVLLSSQDYEHESQRFAKTLDREIMQKHTSQWEYPKHALD